MPMDLITASPKEFLDYILLHRFKNDATETATFLLEALDQLPNMEEISAKIIQESKGQQEKEEQQQKQQQQQQIAKNGLGNAYSLPTPMERKGTKEINRTESTTAQMDVTAITPRIKFKLSIYEHGVVLTSAKQEDIVLASKADCVQHLIFFPKREDCLQKPRTNKEERRIIIPGSMVLAILNRNKVSFRNKYLTQVCFQLPEHFSEPYDVPDSDDVPQEDPTASEDPLTTSSSSSNSICVDSFEEKLIYMFKSSLGLKTVHRVYNPKYHDLNSLRGVYTFQSDDGGQNNSIMQGKMPYLKCYHGVNDGVIYPMKEGLLFFKPPFFVHRSRLHSIAVGRGGGSRYVDLHAVMDAGDGTGTDEEKVQIEFSNIDREEMQVLNNYIHNTLVKAMAKDASQQDGDDEPDDSDGDNDDEDQENDEESDNEGPSRKRYRRAASIEAREVTRRELNTKMPAKKTQNSHQEEGMENDEDDDDDYGSDMHSEEDESEDESDADDESDATVSEEE